MAVPTYSPTTSTQAKADQTGGQAVRARTAAAAREAVRVVGGQRRARRLWAGLGAWRRGGLHAVDGHRVSRRARPPLPPPPGSSRRSTGCRHRYVARLASRASTAGRKPAPYPTPMALDERPPLAARGPGKEDPP